METRKIIYFEEKMDIDNLKNKLKTSQENETVFFIKESCSTVVSEENLSQLYRKIDDYLENYNLFYLSNVMDSCSKKREVIDSFNGFQIYKATSPNGFYAVAARKEIWERIIDLTGDKKDSISNQMNRLVVTGNLNALTSWPRIFNTNQGYDFYPCRDESLISVGETPEYKLSLYYFWIACFILTIFLATFHRYS